MSRAFPHLQANRLTTLCLPTLCRTFSPQAFPRGAAVHQNAAMGLFEGAARKRRAAELQRRLAELDEWDRRYGLGGAPPGHPSLRPDTTWRHHSPEGLAPLRAHDPVPHAGAHRPPRRRRGPLVLFLLAVLLAAGVVTLPEQVATVRGWVAAGGRSVLGLPAGPDTVLAAREGGTRTSGEGGTPGAADPGQERHRHGDMLDEVVQRWTPPAGSTFWGWEPPRGQRVLPPVEAGTAGSFAFLQTQPDGEVPVGFSPCGPVEVAVNPDGAPEEWAELVLASLGRVSAASGLDLTLVGETDEVWSDGPRELGSPVLVTWSDAAGVPALAGMPAGLGGATYVNGPDGRMWHASGQVVLDAADLTRWEQHAAVLDHELAHVLGLDHVDDDGELMAAVNTTGRVSFGPGDLAGLAWLGAIRCPGE